MGSNAAPSSGPPGLEDESIKAIIDRTGYQLEITGGQRKYHSPPGIHTEPSGVGHELYIGQIPNDIYEDKLIPLFEEIGTIWDLRIMMDPVNGKSRGYAFLVYVDRAHAQEAAYKFNGYEIVPGKPLKVNVSVANTRLFLGNIPKSKTKDEIIDELKKHAEGVKDVIIYSTPDTPEGKKNRGFCFVDFVDHKSASDAKRRISRGFVRPWNSDLVVDWADQQEEPDEETMSQVKVLYVKNLKEVVTEERLNEMFQQYGEIDRVKKIRDYAFIHYKERESALKALEAMKDQQIEGVDVEVSLAKPQGDKKSKRHKIISTPKSGLRGGSRGKFGRNPSGNRGRPPMGPYGEYYVGPAGRGGRRGSNTGGYSTVKEDYSSYPTDSYVPYNNPYAGYGVYDTIPNYYGGYDPYAGYAPDPYYSGPYNSPAVGGVGNCGGGAFNRGGNSGGRGRGSKRPGEGQGGPASKRGGRADDFSADIPMNYF